ncbi:leucyl aminopeptidase [Mergibacter septicus]|uniref:leucyl aminopeptidase n=1 Tax=Mergibacter septicus TaxID=221402 RepID=UPI0011792EBF|nr:leucyl aminopeptidase [Mergibacter septicus]AWX14369.1 leucyl aminopeptidase [Mergibacter septicus]
MQFNIIQTKQNVVPCFELQPNAVIVVGLWQDRQLSSVARELDQLSGGVLSQIVTQGSIEGKDGESLYLPLVPNLPVKGVLLVGCGKEDELTERQYKNIIQATVKCLTKSNVESAIYALTEVKLKARSNYWNIRFAIETIAENVYCFDQFKSKKTPVVKLENIFFCQAESGVEQAKLAVAHAQAIIKGIKETKDVANCPPNVCNPAYLAAKAQELAETYTHIETRVVDEKQMAVLGMNAYLAVSRGAENPAFMSIIEFKNNPNPEAKPIVLVGKGLTFDSGGISIKPSAAMDEMKYDMGGAAAVYGVMKAVAELNLPLNIIGVLAGCENMPDGNAYRPGDILTTMSGLTVEVLNTDAEGRLVLCDALTYVERFDPELVIDVATLTGACVVALGAHNSGLISPDDQLASELQRASEQAADRVWRLPMGEEYQEQLHSNFADLANIGGRWGGAITAGCFLSNFTQKYTWAHLDIAGTAWKEGAAKGATGRPVACLVQFLLQQAKQNIA